MLKIREMKIRNEQNKKFKKIDAGKDYELFLSKVEIDRMI